MSTPTLGSSVPPVVATQQDVIDRLTSSPVGITFVHGKAGCGKSWLIRKIVKEVPGCVVLTPTNMAATLYQHASTLHSFFHAGFDDLDEGYQDPANITVLKAEKMKYKLRSISIMIFDEISMVRSDTMEMMHRICCEAMGSTEPFGGIPVVLVGDLFQLPPIVTDEPVFDYLKAEYGGIYFFDSHVIKDNLDRIQLFELEKSYRQQNDPEFVALLDAFRRPLSNQQKVTILEKLNSRLTEEADLPDDAVYISSSNENVSRINALKLDALPGKLTKIDARFRIRIKHTDSYTDLTYSELPTDKDIESIVLPSAFEGQLSFKPGARVMITRSSRWFGYCNGDIGTVKSFNGDHFEILLDNNKVVLCPNPNDRYKSKQISDLRYEMEYDARTHKIKRKTPFIQRTVQFPIKPAYAFTIHKSQGQTYEKVIIDLTSHIFAPGQLYVALSRAKTLDSLYLTKKISYSDIIADDSIFHFLDRVRLAQMHRSVPTAAEISPDYLPTPPKYCDNPRADDFISFVMMNEQEGAVKDFLCHTLASYKAVFALGQLDLALDELVKIIDLVNGTYITDRYTDMLASMRMRSPSENDCRYNLNAIFEIYTDVIRSPRRQLNTDSHFYPK